MYCFIYISEVNEGGGQQLSGPRLTVYPPPRVVFSSNTGTVLECLAEGSPYPTITWLSRDGRTITSSPPYLHLLSNGSLVLHPFSPDR